MKKTERQIAIGETVKFDGKSIDAKRQKNMRLQNKVERWEHQLLFMVNIRYIFSSNLGSHLAVSIISLSEIKKIKQGFRVVLN
jgi:hypothetical protein